MFQFHKVQLTPPTTGPIILKKTFQFHKVQLTQKAHLHYTSFPEFQFHKVQLTPDSEDRDDWEYYVSIP